MAGGRERRKEGENVCMNVLCEVHIDTKSVGSKGEAVSVRV